MTFTDAEMVARIDDTLAHTADHAYVTDGELEAEWVADETFAAELDDATSIDTPVGAHGNWEKIAEAAWLTLTGETILPDWFDELSTVTEMARRSGREPSEVRAALDTEIEALPWRVRVAEPWSVTAEEVVELAESGGVSIEEVAEALQGVGLMCEEVADALSEWAEEAFPGIDADGESDTGAVPSPGCSATVAPITISPGEWSWCGPDPVLVSPLVDLADRSERVQAMGVETVPVVPDEGLLIVSAPTVRTVETPWRRLRAMGLALPALPHRR